ncbi:GNAT family N-acetyltransferase [Glutamicibacter sp. JL.03c]|uniref:GNAT family N-acetyltransferase n=1 Tax=Glutamicibacter sp. JL.03c TaxID=2984842 RepID=UPI0021F7ECF4|nr:GNAT family N-acetyltransferase [Glutamicibacter sp. JL.03c]UYQ76309.1 GNAT family N-acetyltransferase [Glutamicibacter sp. JL.03c]
MKALDHEAIRLLSRSMGRSSEPSHFGDEECQLVLKDEGGRLIGWGRAAWWEPQDNYAPAGYYLSGVEIAHEFQQRGYASRLTAARLAWIAERAQQAWCVVNARNSESLRLQASFGFKEIARADHFGSVWFTGGSGVLLRKDLTGAAGNSTAELI